MLEEEMITKCPFLELEKRSTNSVDRRRRNTENKNNGYVTSSSALKIFIKRSINTENVIHVKLTIIKKIYVAQS